MLVSSGALPALTASQTAPAILSSIGLSKVEYWHKDHLGSLVATTDHSGAVTARYSYDPFGKRRSASGNYDANGALVIDWDSTSSGTDRGYTGHEHLDDVAVIHMNGRIYDPLLGRFMQGDPLIQDPLNLQNFNRYGYCYYNPLTCTDPTGQDFGFTAFAYVMVAIFAADRMNIIDHQMARSFYGIAVSMYLGPAAGQAFTSAGMAQAAVAGFVGGAVSTGTLKGALSGGFSAGMFYGAGNVIGGGDFFGGNVQEAAKWGTEAGVALHGVVGCVTSVVGGGKCGPGALSAAFSKAMTPVTGAMAESNPVAGVIVSAVVGGTGSVLGGGKFANGAQTGAFSYLFNYLAHARYLSKNEGQLVVDQAAKWKGTLYSLVGRNSEIQVAGDCSGTTFKIYDSLGDAFEYKTARDNQFINAADKEGFPFQRLGANDARQPGDVLAFQGHLAIYAYQDEKGNDWMWTASTSQQKYMLQQVKYFGKPVIGTFRYQVPEPGH